MQAVSIPNGMEFYDNDAANQIMSNTFQFPTGWNSTKDCPRASDTKRVSIPNGMEFYFLYYEMIGFGIAKFQFPTGWNSTFRRRRNS